MPTITAALHAANGTRRARCDVPVAPGLGNVRDLGRDTSPGGLATGEDTSAHRATRGDITARAGRRDRQRGQRRAATRRRRVRRDLRGAPAPSSTRPAPRSASCATGDAVVTPGFSLPARWIVHTVGPMWHGGDRGRARVARSCYRRSIEVARAAGATSIAFPAISTGIFGYPPGPAAEIAVATVSAPSPTRSSWCASSHSTTQTCAPIRRPARPGRLTIPGDYRPAMSDIVEALTDVVGARRGLDRRRDPRRLHARRGAHRDRAAPARRRAAGDDRRGRARRRARGRGRRAAHRARLRHRPLRRVHPASTAASSSSFERMNEILEIDLDNHVAVVQPGVTLDQLDEATRAARPRLPVFPGENSREPRRQRRDQRRRDARGEVRRDPPPGARPRGGARHRRGDPHRRQVREGDDRLRPHAAHHRVRGHARARHRGDAAALSRDPRTRRRCSRRSRRSTR